MNKIVTTFVSGALLATTLSADFARVEMGAGTWSQTPSGSLSIPEGSTGFLNLEGDYYTEGKQSTEIYAWMLVKHPIPLIPNLRVEYLSISDVGEVTGKVNGFDVTHSPTTIDMQELDIIPYYNILDNTLWMTVDVGLDFKVVRSDVEILLLGNETGVSALDPFVSTLNSVLPSYTSSDTTIIPFLYLRTRVEIPTTSVGVESDIKYITDGSSTIYDARVKVDYTFEIFPVIQPAFELGYRIQKFDIDADDTKGSLEYAGIYAGFMLRF